MTEEYYDIHNPILLGLFIVFVILNVIDMITTVVIGHAAESNPIVIWTGTVWSLLILKIIWVWLFYSIYKVKDYKSEFTYYVWVSVVIYSITVYLIAVCGNIYGILTPGVIEQATAMSSQDKMEGYSSFIGLIYMLPMSFNLLIFWVYLKTKKYITFGEKNGRKIRNKKSNKISNS
jgi:hypothetical protein